MMMIEYLYMMIRFAIVAVPSRRSTQAQPAEGRPWPSDDDDDDYDDDGDDDEEEEKKAGTGKADMDWKPYLIEFLQKRIELVEWYRLKRVDMSQMCVFLYFCTCIFLAFFVVICI